MNELKEQILKPGQIYISNLVNAVFYYLHCAFIMTVNGKYRLVVLRNNRVLTYTLYETLRGAKIAFSKKFKGWKEDVIAEWSHLYDPEKNWLEEKLSLVDKSITCT